MGRVGGGAEKQGPQNLVFHCLHLNLLLYPEVVCFHIIPVSGSSHIPLWHLLVNPLRHLQVYWHALPRSQLLLLGDSTEHFGCSVELFWAAGDPEGTAAGSL